MLQEGGLAPFVGSVKLGAEPGVVAVRVAHARKRRRAVRFSANLAGAGRHRFTGYRGG